MCCGAKKFVGSLSLLFILLAPFRLYLKHFECSIPCGIVIVVIQSHACHYAFLGSVPVPAMFFFMLNDVICVRQVLVLASVPMGGVTCFPGTAFAGAS